MGESLTRTPEVIVVEYDERWPALFEEERARILALISPWVERIEHIGSTSVPGLGAKPIIDIMVGLRSLDDARECIPRLESIGYEYIPKHEASLPERRYFHKGGTRRARTHHLHMVETTSCFWQRHLLFRDRLRADPALARRYYELKTELAARFPFDRDAYTSAKAPFIEELLSKSDG
jgi:GrpB-like predicted nucleotidyltransferase (UPF0157 family)